MIAKTETNYTGRNALIVGGGPAGLATALILAKRGWTNVTVLEQHAADFYESNKSYSYRIDGRGQKLLDFLGLTNKLSNISVPSTEFYFTRIQPNGSRKTLKVPVGDPNQKTSYWLPRKAFVMMLYQEIERNWHGCITVMFNTKCGQINRIATNNDNEEKLEIIAYSENNHIVKFEPYLLVGCDGVNSIVRNTLKEWNLSKAERFEMKRFPSPSTGLRYKALTLPPKFPLDKSGSERAACEIAYSIRGAFRGRKRAIFLGVFPLKDPNETRSANIVTLPDHDIWKLKNGEELYNFFEKAFPQLSIRQLVPPEEAERFAKSEGGSFPPPQYCSSLHYLLKQEQASQGMSNKSSAGVVLLGDVIHCFPPDIGQGVNAALEDVHVFNQALSDSHDELSHALPLYESLRFPDVKALVSLAQFAFPWQYNQAPLRKSLWSVNVFLRLVLSKLLPYVFNPPAFILLQNHQLSYQEILARAQRTTNILYVIGLILACGLLVSVWRITQPQLLQHF